MCLRQLQINLEEERNIGAEREFIMSTLTLTPPLPVFVDHASHTVSKDLTCLLLL